MDLREALEVVARLIARALSAGGKWPLPSEEPTLRWINTWAAIYDNDADQLKRVANWDGKRTYKVDALGERIALAWAHYLFGEAPTIKPASDNDLGNYSELVRLNRLTDELQRAAGLCVAEGEIWPRIFVDPLIADRPLLDWVSRANVFPLWVGPRLAAAAIVTVLDTPNPNAAKGVTYRHFEVHAPGVVANLLFVGTTDKLGELRPLEEHPDLAELNTDGADLAGVPGIGAGRAWVHGLPGLLVGRVPNLVKRRRTIGISDYAGILDDLLDLNEAKAIGSSNMRLSARRRVVLSAAVAARAARRGIGVDGELNPEETYAGEPLPGVKWDPSEEVLVEEPLDRELGKEGKDPVRVIDYSFDATPLIEWKRDIVETALSRVGMTPQYVGAASASPDGYAISGTALRLRLIPTDAAGRGKGGGWDGALPTILRTMAMVDALPAANGGLGHTYADLNPPAVTRKPGLPEDELEETEKHSRRVQSGIESVETAVRQLNPEWDDDQVNAEVDRIRKDRAAGASGGVIPTGF